MLGLLLVSSVATDIGIVINYCTWDSVLLMAQTCCFCRILLQRETLLKEALKRYSQGDRWPVISMISIIGPTDAWKWLRQCLEVDRLTTMPMSVATAPDILLRTILMTLIEISTYGSDVSLLLRFGQFRGTSSWDFVTEYANARANREEFDREMMLLQFVVCLTSFYPSERPLWVGYGHCTTARASSDK